MTGHFIHSQLGNGFFVSVVLLSVLSIWLIIQYCCLKREHCKNMIILSSVSLAILFLTLLICEIGCLHHIGGLSEKNVVLASIQFISTILLIVVFIVYCLPLLCMKIYEVLPIINHSSYFGVLMACGYVCWRMNWMVFSVFHKYRQIACFVFNLLVYVVNCIAWTKYMDFSTFSIEDANMLLGYVDL